MRHLYLEKLKRLSKEDLLTECNLHGKKMEHGNMTRADKDRALMCFRYAMKMEELALDDRMMLATAVRVLRLM